MVSDEINVFPFLESPFDETESRVSWEEQMTYDTNKVWRIKFN